VLHRRLILLAIASLAVVACSEGGAIEENVVRPGITAITEDAPAAACAVNAGVLRAAVESYTLLEGEPPPDEQALLDAGYLREATTDWDVVDGELVPENPACGAIDDAPITTLDIVTEAEPLDADDVYQTLDAAAIESLGGEACARELAAIIAAAETFLAERDAEPADIEELVTTGYLERVPERWQLVGAELLPVDGSGCNVLE
jgi:competence protein ComGC